MTGSQRPSPPFRYSAWIFGSITYFAMSFPTSTFFAPFGMIMQLVPNCGFIRLPSLVSGRPRVMTSFSSSFCFLSIASSVDKVPSKSMTHNFEWNALLSSASFQLIELGGM